MNTYKKILALMILSLLVFHDFLFLNIFDFFGGYLFLNLWKELLVAIYVFLVVAILPVFNFNAKLNVPRKLILALFFSALIFFLWGGATESAVKTFRSLVMPLFISFVIVGLVGSLNEKSMMKVFNFICYIYSVVAFYGLYQTYSVNSISNVWYYNILERQGFELKEWDIFRDGMVRISSFFTSSLEFACFMLFAGTFFLSILTVRRKTIANLFLFGGAFCFLMFIIFISSVRTAQIGIVLTLFNYAYILFNSKRKNIFLVGLLSSSSIIGFTFFYLSSGYSDDLSALGRVVQWGSVYNLVMSFPMGMGLGYVGPSEDAWFDSFLLNCFATMGFGAFVIVFFILAFYKKITEKYINISGDVISNILGMTLVVFFPTFIFILFFQALYNSSVMYFICIYTGLFLSRLKN